MVCGRRGCPGSFIRLAEAHSCYGTADEPLLKLSATCCRGYVQQSTGQDARKLTNSGKDPFIASMPDRRIENSSDRSRPRSRHCRYHASHPTIVRARPIKAFGLETSSALADWISRFCDSRSRPWVSSPTREDQFRMTTVWRRMFVA